MARIRTIKPEFWTDEKLSECSLSARLLFVGLISHADDVGRLDYSPTRLRLQIFPCGKVTHGELIEWLMELSERSLIRAYTLENKHYLDIPGFAKHQRINRPTGSRIPAFDHQHAFQIIEDSLSTHRGNGREGKGMERKGSQREGEHAPRTSRAPSGTRIPDDFTLTPERREYAVRSRVDPERTFAMFSTYWRGKSSNATKRDWDATWQHWVLKDSKDTAAKQAPRKTRYEQVMEHLDAN